ncbi:MAG: hypothetical protein AAF830_09075 [Pseudomonadota bacterium]
MSKKDDFFIGWSADTPGPDRRFLLGASALLLGGAGGLAWLGGTRLNAAGPGNWAMGDMREWRGFAVAEPYPMLRYLADDGTVRTALLGCMNKCAPKLMIDQHKDQPVIVRGSPIQRGPHLMIATEDFGAWIEPTSDQQPGDADLAFPEPEALEDVSLAGEILDTKCWFGAMRPSEGKVHKACASLCIRGGLPPAFYPKSLREQSRLLIMTDTDGNGIGEDILPYVADRVAITGTMKQMGDLLILATEASTITRL